MTTPRDEATALLAAAADVLRELDIIREYMDRDGHVLFVHINTHEALRRALASPTLAADLEFAAAWRRVERALPGGWAMERLFLNYLGDELQWTAEAGWQRGELRGHGTTKEAALTHLAETLEAMR